MSDRCHISGEIDASQSRPDRGRYTTLARDDQSPQPYDSAEEGELGEEEPQLHTRGALSPSPRDAIGKFTNSQLGNPTRPYHRRQRRLSPPAGGPLYLSRQGDNGNSTRTYHSRQRSPSPLFRRSSYVPRQDYSEKFKGGEVRESTRTYYSRGLMSFELSDSHKPSGKGAIRRPSRPRIARQEFCSTGTRHTRAEHLPRPQKSRVEVGGIVKITSKGKHGRPLRDHARKTDCYVPLNARVQRRQTKYEEQYRHSHSRPLTKLNDSDKPVPPIKASVV